MLFKLVYQKMGVTVLSFQAIVPQRATYLCRKPGSIEKSRHFVCARANHALRAITRKFCAIRMRNAIP